MTNEMSKCIACNAEVYIESTRCNRCGADLENQRHALKTLNKVVKKQENKNEI